MTPTPTAPGRTVRKADFATLTEALDFAATQETGINIHSLRGELVEVIPYAALHEQAIALAGRLLGSGLTPGDRIMLCAESDGDFLRTFFACQYAGLAPAPCPLPAPLGGKEAYVEHVRRMMMSADVRAAFAPAAIAPWFEEAGEGLGLTLTGTLDALSTSGEASLPAPDPAGLSYLQFSSGSTRFPTGVAVTQQALLANVQAIGKALDLVGADRAVSWLPLYHDMGLVGMLLSALGFQVSLDLVPTGAFVRRPTLWLDLISKRRGTISYAPTFGFDLAARRAGAAPADLDLSSWRVAGLGGDMIRPEPLRTFAAAYAPMGFDSGAYLASYGMAEATLALSLTPVGQGLRTDLIDMDCLETEQIARAPGPRTSRTREFALCGRTLDGHQLEVRDETGTVLEPRRVGRIFARGPSLMQAYYGAPEETAQVISNGWLDTGDLGYVLDDQIVITGRAKDLIIVNGRNLWPQDLEWTAEREVESLRSGDVAVFSVDPTGEAERIVALVQCRSSDPTVREALIANVAAVVRSRHGVELDVVLVGAHALPQTSSGKLSRSKARALYVSGAFERPLAASTV